MRRARLTVLGVMLLSAAWPAPAFAGRPRPAPDGGAPACVDAAARHYGVPAWAVRLILDQEGGRVGTVHRNTDGSVDYGPMQINSSWVPRIAAARHSAQGPITRALVNDGCYNVWTGTWLLSREVGDAGGNLWAGIGLYHSPTPALRLSYLRQVVARARKVLRGPVHQVAGSSLHDREAAAR